MARDMPPEPPPWGEVIQFAVSDPADTYRVDGQRGQRFGKLTVYTDADVLTATPRDYFLKGIISPKEMSVVYGEPGCGKSFLVLYIGRIIAQGKERRIAFGRRVHETNVLFMALEGVAGFENRLKAQIQQHSDAPGFGYIAQPVNLFSDDQAKNDTILAAQQWKAGLIIIDTLNRAMVGGSENDPADMGQFIANIDAIRAATNAHILIVHHCGKDSGRGLRGHSSLLGAADVVIEVSKDKDTGLKTAVIEKAKDDSDGHEFSFALDVVELGIDPDGDPITTCTVRELDGYGTAQQTKKENLSQDEMVWMKDIRELFVRQDRVQRVRPEKTMSIVDCVKRDDLREWIRARGLVGITESMGDDAALDSGDRKKIERMLKALKKKGRIGVFEDWIWIV